MSELLVLRANTETAMKTFRLQTRLWLPQAREHIFGFFSDPKNLERITPLWLRFEITGITQPILGPGTRIDYRLRIRGLPIRWQSEITTWEPPVRFVDQQIHGPYKVWLHEHTFDEHAGGTLIRDDVRYAVPGGKVVQRLLVAPDLDRIFQYRREVLQTIFNPAGAQPSATEGRC